MPKSNGSVGKLNPTLKPRSCRVTLRGVRATTVNINQSNRTKANQTTAKTAGTASKTYCSKATATAKSAATPRPAAQTVR